MNLIPDILKPYIGICKHLPAYSTICRYIFGFRFFPENYSTPRPCRPKFPSDSSPSNARGGEPCTGHGSDGFLLYHTASLRGSHLEGRSVRIRPRRFAFRGLRVASDARRRREGPRRRPEPRADDGDAARAPGVAGRYQPNRRAEIHPRRKTRRAHGGVRATMRRGTSRYEPRTGAAASPTARQ